ncbi:MAG: sensor histidine kinase [Hyphomicrobiales bacterium]|nr:sensor histidine kinase [Hyphomicrobiales bacterium]
MVFSRFESVRGRLLAVITLILVPIALISIILATTTYRTVSRSIEISQVEVGSNYAVRVRVWFRGILRTLVATSAALQMDGEDSVTCARRAESVRAGTIGLQAIMVRTANGPICGASNAPSLTPGVLSALLIEQSTKESVSLWGGTEMGQARYDVVSVGGHKHLLVYVRAPQGPAFGSDALMLVDPSLLDITFDVGTFESGGIVALVNRGADVIVARGIAEADTSWLPINEPLSGKITRSRLPNASGRSYVYVSQIVAGPDLYVLARFDNSAADAAFYQFLVLCFTPLLMLCVLFAAYVWAIEGNVLRWLKVIAQAARARRDGRIEQVAIAEAMPSDVKLLAASFNDMVSDADSRERALRASFEANQYLMRELHHRVKNSLQVIQSYLALSRRLNKRSSDRHLIETEAKVQVLSTAYRLALLEGTMRPVPLGAFAREILDNLATALKRQNQWVDIQINADAGLIVDRTIPIGLALVEAVAAGLAAQNAQTVRVAITSDAAGYIAIAVATDGVLGPNLPPPKIMAGLALQIGAMVLPTGDGDILHWRFVP